MYVGGGRDEGGVAILGGTTVYEDCFFTYKAVKAHISMCI